VARILWRTPPPARRLGGAALTLLAIAVAVAGLLPVRSSIDLSTAALVLVVPVAIGVAVGGFPVLPLGVLGGFVAFDFFFIPPYYTLDVGAAEHWVSVGVYTAVGLIVGGVVAQVQGARAVAEERESEVRMLYDLSQVVAGSDSLADALSAVARLARQRFDLDTVAILLGDPASAEPGGGLRIVACAGPALAEADVERLAHALPGEGFASVPGPAGLMAGPLPTVTGPAGLLAVTAPPLGPERARLLTLFATQAGVAVERARLAEETARGRTLAEVDRLRSALMGAVSHDLRTPLASIKASVSDLANPGVALGDDDRGVLLSTIEEETDRLTRFVTNLLDMTRIESGGLQVNRSATPLYELIEDVLVRFGTLFRGPVSVDVPDDLPLVDVDYMLVEQVLANLLENVIRHCPAGTATHIGVRSTGSAVEVRVSDDGPGIPAGERERVFAFFYQARAGGPGGTGMGLAICRGIIEAHGGQIWVEPTPGGGSSFAMRLPLSAVPADPELAPSEPGP
jgi:two-component system, OmpR family, sensor histidine kinase KdpD